jgi:hypothetical protein
LREKSEDAMKKVHYISSIKVSLFIIITNYTISCGGGDSGDGGGGSGGGTIASWKGAKLLGTVSDDRGWGVAVDTAGNVYVTGYTSGSLDGNTNIGGTDMFLVKYNSTGTKQWTRQLGTASSDRGFGIAVDARGNVYVTGQTSGGLDGNTSAGGGDMFLVKYDANGVKQ